jgi:hypothetical protein
VRDATRIGMAVVGGVLSMVGLALSAAWLIWPLLHRDDPVVGSAMMAGAAALALLYGLILVTQAFRGEDATAPWPPAWILFLLWGGVLILGALTLANADQDALAPWIFPVLHVLAVALPIVAILAYASRRAQAPAGRVSVQFVYGGTLAIAISLVIEVGLLLALGALALLFTGGTTSLGTFVAALVSGNLAPLGDLRATPVLLAFVAGWRIILSPVVEEAAKALTIPFWPHWGPTRERALVWGLAAGLGFALTEGMFTTVQAVGPGAWWPALLGRAGAALVYGMATGLVGLAWWRGYTRHRPLNVVVGYLAAVVVHAFWNLGAVARAIVGDIPLGTQTTQEPAYDVLVADLLGVGGALLLILLLAGILIRVTSRSRWAEESA